MELPDDWAGRQGRCPQCSKVLHIPGKRPSPQAEPPRVDAAEQVQLAAQPCDQTIAGTPPLTTHHSPLTNVLSSPAWLAAIAGGVTLLGIGLFLVLRGGGPNESHAKAGAGAENRLDQSQLEEAQGSQVFRPHTQPDQQEKQPKGDIESADVGQPQVASSKVPDTPEPRTKTPLAPVAPEKWGLRDFGVSILPGASVIEVDGVVLAVRNPSDLAGQAGVPLVLPYGTHIVRFARTDPPRVVKPERWFLEAYREAVAQVQEDGRWSFDRLLELSRRSLDRFTEPLVPHLWGNFYWQEGQHEAAIRHYSWALEIAPTFAPSYFNLAQLAHERGDDDTAHRYLRLADLWNAQNAYGLSNAVNVLRATLGPGEPALEEDEPDWFVADHGTLTTRDQDMIAVLRSAAEFAPQATERAKILNNLGAYFEHVGKPELALESYRTAASVLGAANLENEQRRVIRGILDNLTRVCRNADMPEYKRYERLQAMVER